jgi:1,2-diacylglycerol 3-beta-glucosyltransferase
VSAVRIDLPDRDGTLNPAGVSALALGAVECWLGFSTGYLLALLGLAATRRGDARTAEGDGEPQRAVVVVPAHDEAAGIADTVASLAAQAEVIVVADNCSDATAVVAATAGATVWERDAPDARGKGQALAWAFERLWHERPDTEMVVVVDADCIATTDLVARLDRALRDGAPAAQARYDVANPEASATAALRWAGFALMHRVRPRGRAALGLSADLFGTGMAFRAELLRALPWRSFSVTEDAEYHVRLVEAGHRVAYVGEAGVASPMPTTDAAAREQQLRWESGNAGLARATVVRLVRRGLRRRDPELLHAGLEQLVPPQALLLAADGACLVAGVALRRRAVVAGATLIAAGQAAYVLGGLRVAGAPPAVYRALLRSPALVARKLAVLLRVGSGRGATAWVRTERETPPTPVPDLVPT